MAINQRTELLPRDQARRKWALAFGAVGLLGYQTLSKAQTPDSAETAGSPEAVRGPTKEDWLDQYFGAKGFGPPLAVARFLDRTYYLIRNLSWTATGESKGLKEITAPTGFVTDFASIPRPFWAFLAPDDEYVTAAVVHDWLYWNQATSRSEADQALKDCMVELGVDAVKVTAIYQGVRLFGASAWEGNAALKAKGERRVLKKYPTDLTVRWETWKLEPDVFL